MTRWFHIAGPLAALAAAAPLYATDVPARKSGLWEMTTQTRAGGQAMPGPMTMQMCIDQKRDDVTADPKDMRDLKQRCSKMDVRRNGRQTVIDSVCTHDGHTVTSRMTLTGNLATGYRMETVSHFAPAMHGMTTMESTMTGKWLGPCKPGQAYGSVTMSGMPGMGPGGFKMDAQTMERMRQMQQQYGR